MTYCVAMLLDTGMVFLSDSRTNAGVDQIATFRKTTVFQKPGERGGLHEDRLAALNARRAALPYGNPVQDLRVAAGYVGDVRSRQLVLRDRRIEKAGDLLDRLEHRRMIVGEIRVRRGIGIQPDKIGLLEAVHEPGSGVHRRARRRHPEAVLVNRKDETTSDRRFELGRSRRDIRRRHRCRR